MYYLRISDLSRLLSGGQCKAIGYKSPKKVPEREPLPPLWLDPPEASFRLGDVRLTGNASVRAAIAARAWAENAADPTTLSDLVMAIPSSLDRISLVEAGRSWRRGIHTHVTFELDIAPDPLYNRITQNMAAHNESIGVFADLADSKQFNSKPGDVRAALTPFLANTSVGVGNYKWMLYGDDDTVFYLNNVLELVQGLDHNMPYLITDHVWWPDHRDGRDHFIHANRRAPRCLPCNYRDPLAANKSLVQGQFAAVPACPCTPQVLCEVDNVGAFNRGGCGFNYFHPGNWYFLHGGAGAIISSGLMRQNAFEEVKDYILSHKFTSGDSMFTQVVHDVIHVLPTDPGYGFFRPHIRMFDPGWRGEIARGPEDEQTSDLGNDPGGIIER
ncbi:hypothetical protein WJX72_001195 [[Myrmecia] bisecta]|uniref:Hexosyltransferase n=1 Tax=[Myrmecia] bisecta TaxID=41462 RepID=A0AAW1R4D5_9CHLO